MVLQEDALRVFVMRKIVLNHQKNDSIGNTSFFRQGKPISPLWRIWFGVSFLDSSFPKGFFWFSGRAVGFFLPFLAWEDRL